MLLAAGRGERMRPLTDTCPKPLLEVGGKPLIVWHIERLARCGFAELVINHAHLGSMIESALGSGARYGVRIRYSREAHALETAGGIANALELLGSAPFAVINSDIYCDYDPTRLHASAQAISEGTRLAHLVLVPNPAHHPDGDFSLVNQEVGIDAAPRLTFSGIAVYAPSLFRTVTPGDKARLLPLLQAAIRQRQVAGEIHFGRWVDVGTPQRLFGLNQELKRGSLA
jgi:MurNAc alpha-1-phosphate uridylyltransferase